MAQAGTPGLDFAVVVRPAGRMIGTWAMLRAIPVYAGAWCSVKAEVQALGVYQQRMEDEQTSIK